MLAHMRQGDLCELEASLVYLVCSGLARDAQQDSVLDRNKKIKKKEENVIR